MGITQGFAGTVGNTPLIRLRAISEETGCEILGKAEFMNPGGSVKDRAARAIVTDAEQRGELPPGGSVVEGTAGNTGIGLAHVCNERGYRCIIVMPDNQSPEKYRLLEMLGAEVYKVPTVPYSNPNQYQKVSQRLAGSLRNAIWANQFDNPINRHAHLTTTGPEIWEQTGGRISAFVAASGTGGTLAGTAEYLKSRNPTCAACWPTRRAAVCMSSCATARSKPPAAARSPRASASHASPRTSRMRRWMTPCTSRTATRCITYTGCCAKKACSLGSTSGINVAAAVRVAKDMGPGHTHRHRTVRWRRQISVSSFQSRMAREQGSGGTCPAGTAANEPIHLENVLVA